MSPCWTLYLSTATLLGAFVLLGTLLRPSTTIQIGGDEGFELAKSLLRLRNHTLYSEVWNDQPPLHTLILAGVLTHVWPSIAGARLLTSSYSCCLLLAMWMISFRVGGFAAAISTTTMLMASPGFLALGASVMLEIPALAPAVLALGMLAAFAGWGRWPTEMSAGVLFGIALMTKLVPVVLLPLAVLIIVLRKRQQTNLGALPSHVAWIALLRATLRPACLFLIVAAVSFISLDVLLEQGTYLQHFQQSWTSHFGNAKSVEYGSPNDYSFDWTVLLKHWDTSLPAMLGVLACVRRARQDPMQILPPVWLILSLLVFGLHKPWWTYYYVHTAIPLCLCAGIGLAAAWGYAVRRLPGSGTANSRKREGYREKPKPRQLSGLARPWTTALLALYITCAGPWIIGRMYVQIITIRNSPQTYYSPVLAEMKRYKPFTQWLYTDDPIYSFHSEIPLPPDLAVVMLKRFWSGEMTNARLAAEVREYAPGLILLRKPAAETPLNDLIQSDYRLVYYDNDHRLYAHKTVSEKPGL